VTSDDPSAEARERREHAAHHYRPKQVKLLLVAEAPPRSLDRYFYFHDVREHDSLFRYVVRVLFGVDPDRANKEKLLLKLRDEGVFLIDLAIDPLDDGDLASHVLALVERCKAIAPEKIVLIKATVYDAAFAALRAAGLPVVDERIPFPGSGRQREFEESFSRALGKGSSDPKPEPQSSHPEVRKPSQPRRGPTGGVTLHEEIAEILRSHGTRWLTTVEIAREVNARAHYRKRDDSEVTPYQIHGRTKNYPQLFERQARRYVSSPDDDYSTNL
jgi:hypothetical protein